ncbi:MAG: type II secretion system protein [Planctomycetota bacterium]|nr:type II secretion system protein [Planctomycetota bacterium]
MRRYAFTLIELMIVIAILTVIAAISIPNVLSYRKHGNEVSAINSLRSISSAQAIYKERNVRGFYGEITDLTNAKLLDTFEGADKSGYSFNIKVGKGTPIAQQDYLWSATANPKLAGTSGDRYFFVDQSYVIRFNREEIASAKDSATGGK